MIGMFVHWVYGPHTTDGGRGQGQPAALAGQQFLGPLAGPRGLAQHRRLPGDAWSQALARLDRRARLDAADPCSWSGSTSGARADRSRYAEDEISYHAPHLGRGVRGWPCRWRAEIRRRRVLILMLGDTSMGMINGYFGPRLLNQHGFTEHKIDQAWIIDRGRRIDEKRIDDALRFVKDKGADLPLGRAARDGLQRARRTREQLRDYLAVLDMVEEFKADCLGWQYQLGLIPLRPPSDLAEGLFNSTCRPESNGDTIAMRDRGRSGQRGADGDDEAAARGRRASIKR